MAHNLYENLRTGKVSFVSRREIPWHIKGTIVESMTSAECMKEAGLDFLVDKAPLYAGVGVTSLNANNIDRGSNPHIVSPIDATEPIAYRSAREVKGQFATVRTDTNTVLGIVGSRYEIIQNTEAFGFFDTIIGEGHASYETAGALGNGETVFITAKLPTKLIVNKEDIDKYLLFTMAHDGSGSIQIMFTPIRVVCNNTLSAAIAGNTNKVSIRHTKNAQSRIDEAHKILGISGEQAEKYERAFTKFSQVKISDVQLNNFIDNVFSFETNEEDISTKANNKRDNILEYYEVGVGQEGIQGTVWGAYNAVTGYLQNTQAVRSEDTFFKNTFFKTDANIRGKAMQKALELAYAK